MTHLFSRREFIASVSAAIAASGIAWVQPVTAQQLDREQQVNTQQLDQEQPLDAQQLDRITRVAIHPAIGVARVGNSRDAFFFGPEVPGALPAGPFKDPAGAIAKQAARFRIFGYDAHHQVVAELTAQDANISWHVAVANTKPAWYQIDTAFDVEGAPGVGRRNSDVADRAALVVQATPRTLDGAGAGPLPLDGGRFRGMPVTLGEVMTDADGRLVVLPGAGGAYSAPDAPPLSGFGDNNGWTDDTCDGPVRASVRIGDRSLEADPAWVMCVPPNYAPGVPTSIVTVHDAVESALVDAVARAQPDTVFERDVWPIFQRLSDLQWVNEGFFQRYGFGAPRDWTDNDWRLRLADNSDQNSAVREGIFALFRDPAYVEVQPDAEPLLYGDKAAVPPDAIEPRQWLTLTPLQYRHLKAWSEGHFRLRDDGPSPTPSPARLEDFPLEERPSAIDRAALDACLGGAFHPGIEFPWIVRTAWIWTDDMRLKTTATEVDLTDYGDTLVGPVAISTTGPLSRLGPGSMTHWMGVPWHADASSCRFGYARAISPILPGFWPARIPNGVLAEADYGIVMDTARSLDDRHAAFNRRRDWERFISAATRPPILAAMAQDWFKLGMIEDRPGPADGAFPAAIKVESGVGFAHEPDTLYPAGAPFPQLGQFPLVVSNSDDNSLRLVDADANVTVMQLSAPLEGPAGLMRGLDGNIYVCCMHGNIIRRVTPQGEVTLFAQGSFSAPTDITGDRAGNFYVANFDKKGFVTAIAPDGTTRVLVPPEAGLVEPVGVVVTPDGALLVSWGGDFVARVDIATGKVLNPRWISGLSNPRQMAWDTSHRLWLADQLDDAVRRYDMLGTQIPLTIVGAGLVEPAGLAFDSKGLLYATLAGGSLVKRIRLDGDVAVVSDFAAGMRNGGGIAFIG